MKITQNVAFEIFQFWRFPLSFVLLKVTCLVTLFLAFSLIVVELSDLSGSTDLAFFTNICLVKVSGNTVLPQATGFQGILMNFCRLKM